MGKLTPEVFNESCCDGGSCPKLDDMSAQSCGCDRGYKVNGKVVGHLCERHQIEHDLNHTALTPDQ